MKINCKLGLWHESDYTKERKPKAIL